jgi:hypothetical protein
VYLVQLEGSNPAFQASRFENVTRMGLPADRVDDVYLFVGAPEGLAQRQPSLDGDAVHDAVARLYASRAAAALSRPHAVFLLAPLDGPDWSRAYGQGTWIAKGTRVLSSPIRHGAGDAPLLQRISPLDRLGYALLFLLGFFLVGLVAVRRLFRSMDPAALALAPAIGAGVITLVCVAVLAIR